MRIARASPCACSTKPITLMPSTGKTHGMRFSRMPPMNAKASATSDAAADAPRVAAPRRRRRARGGRERASPTTGASTAIALRLRARPADSETATPRHRRARPASGGSASFISMRSALPSRVSFCGAAGSISSSRSGKNATFCGQRARPRAASCAPRASCPRSPTRTSSPAGSTGSCARARSKCAWQRGLSARGSAAATATREVELALLRDADVLAHQPLGLRLDRVAAGLGAGGRA